MFKKALVFIIGFSGHSLFGQVPAITGWVYDKETLETIPGAVIVNTVTNENAQSNTSGYYQLPTTRGDKTIAVAAPGYRPIMVLVEVEFTNDEWYAIVWKWSFMGLFIQL